MRQVNGDGGWVQFRNELPAEQPLLVWFWAPHWPFCRREAPAVEQFARDHSDTLRVVGLGTQDSAQEAVDFVRDYGTYSFPMYWDETFVSWDQFGIRSQPAAALLSPSGDVIGAWLGPFPEDEVLELAAQASA